MEGPITVTALFPGNTTEVFSTLTFREVAKQLLNRNYKATEEPLLLTIARHKESLYYDAHALTIYLNAPDGWQQLYDTTWCDGLYRNKSILISGSKVEAHCLWLKRRSILLLYDNDDRIWSNFNVHENLFYKIA